MEAGTALGVLSTYACWGELTSNPWHMGMLEDRPRAMTGPDEVHKMGILVQELEGCMEKDVE